MDDTHVNHDKEAQELAEKIIADLKEPNAAEFIRQIVSFIGARRGEDLYKETLKIEDQGGMLTKRGDRRRTPGGVFIELANRNLSNIERELLFPSGRTDLSTAYLAKELQSLTTSQLEVGVKRIQQGLDGELGVIDSAKRAQFLQLKQLLLARTEEMKNGETRRSIDGIKEAVNEIPDKDARSQLLARIEELEKIAAETKTVSRQAITVQEERQHMLIQEEAFERRTQTRLKVYEQFLARESIASIVGGVLLVVIVVALLVAMFAGKTDAKIIENGFLVILGYFFGQTVVKARQGKAGGAGEPDPEPGQPSKAALVDGGR